MFKCFTRKSHTSPHKMSARARKRKLHIAKEAEIFRHHVIVIGSMSGKGGVSKTVDSILMAKELAARGFKVGLLELDLNTGNDKGSLSTYCPERMSKDQYGRFVPVELPGGIKFVSIDFVKGANIGSLEDGSDFRNLGRQFLIGADWSGIDYLVVDTPANSTAGPFILLNLFFPKFGVLISTQSAKSSVENCMALMHTCYIQGVFDIGIIETMSGAEDHGRRVIVEETGEPYNPFGSGGGEELATHNPDYPWKFLGRIPLDPMIRQSCDCGHALDIPVPQAIKNAVDRVLEMDWDDC